MPSPTIAALIPTRVLLAVQPFSSRLCAAQIGAALAEGLRAGGRTDHALLELPDDVAALPDNVEAQMRAAHAIVIVVRSLEPAELRGTVAFELATTARQAGVPAYAVTAHNGLDAFDARLLDLQVILEARTAKALRHAGGALASVM